MKTEPLLASVRRQLPVAATFIVLVAAGCQTYQQQSSEFSQSTRTGNLASAIAKIDKQAESNKGSKDEVVWRLEQGMSLRSAALADMTLVPSPQVASAPAPKAGEPPVPPPPPPTADEVHQYYLKRSVAAFDLAEQRIEAYDEAAKVKIGSEVGAALTNQATLPYRGRAHDKILLDAYQALNYLQLGSKDEARVQLNRSLQRQRDAVAENEKRIAEAQEIAEKAKTGQVPTDEGKKTAYDTQKAQADPKTGPALQQVLADSTAPLKAYGDYVNPFVVFLDGLYFSTVGENGSDWERGRQAMERVASIVPENPYLREDLTAAQGVAEGKPINGLTYVIFETGTGPARDQVRLDIPTFLVTRKLAYVGAAFPRLRFNDDYVPNLAVSSGGQNFSTATLASVDGIVANDFKNEWPSIVTKTLITTATKAIVQATVQKQLDDRAGTLGSLIGAIAMTAINAATNIADTRAWTSLPKEFQYARLATPADRQLTLSAGAITQTVTLMPGSINVVYVKSTSKASPLFVSQFVLR